MMLRKGEITTAGLRRQWRHHVALAADKAQGVDNSAMVRGFADTLAVAPRTYHVCRDDSDYVEFCFAKPEDARAFCDRCGGERSATPPQPSC